MKTFILLTTLLALSLSNQLNAIEYSVSGRGTSNKAVTTLSNQVGNLSLILEQLGTQLGRIQTCNSKRGIYTPSDSTADSDGCVVMPTSAITAATVCPQSNEALRWNGTSWTCVAPTQATAPAGSSCVGTWVEGACAANKKVYFIHTCTGEKQIRSTGRSDCDWK